MLTVPFTHRGGTVGTVVDAQESAVDPLNRDLLCGTLRKTGRLRWYRTIRASVVR